MREEEGGMREREGEEKEGEINRMPLFDFRGPTA